MRECGTSVPPELLREMTDLQNKPEHFRSLGAAVVGATAADLLHSGGIGVHVVVPYDVGAARAVLTALAAVIGSRRRRAE
jgi:5,10-methylenetetrahydrofolate reductase